MTSRVHSDFTATSLLFHLQQFAARVEDKHGGRIGGHPVRSMSEASSNSIAIIDHDASILESLSDLIESSGFRARCFESAKAFLESDFHRKAVCLIVDVRMPVMSGLELQAKLKREKECNVPIVFITTFDDPDVRIQAMNGGAAEVLTMPFHYHFLIKTLRAAIDTVETTFRRLTPSVG